LLFSLSTNTASAALSPGLPSGSDHSVAHVPAHPSESSRSERLYNSGAEAHQAGDIHAAIQWWRLAAAEGHLLSQYNLGSAYASGVGVPVDILEATHWWRMAALQGSVDAQYNLGVIYFEGKGVTRNISEASMWWYMAAMGGDPAAQFRLGYLAATGTGGDRNLRDAQLWWQRAAEQGFELAIKALELLNRSESMLKADNK
jgi:TPR repeat protein